MAIINVNGISGINSITAQSSSLNFFTAAGNTLSIGASVSGNITGNVTGNVAGNVTGAINSTGVSTITTLNATSIVGVTTAGITTAYIGSVNDGPISGARNRIINGDMRIDQRNAGASVTVNLSQAFYGVDRWTAGGITSDGVFTIQQNTSAPAGFNYSTKVTVTTADSSLTSQTYNFQQRIEGYNVADFGYGATGAKTVTLSFWTRSSVTGTHGGVIQNSAQNYCYPFTYSISVADTWEYKTITIPGPTAGTWLTTNGIGLIVFFNIGAGSDLKGTAGSWAASSLYSATGAVDLINTLNATWYITGVQLEPGTVATPFERRSYGQELALCQRYYEKSYNQDTVPGTSVTSTYAGLHITATVNTTTSVYIGGTIVFRQPKRTASSVSYWDAAGNASKFSTLTGGGLALSNNVGALQSVYSCDNQMGFTVLPGTSNMAMFGWAVSTEL